MTQTLEMAGKVTDLTALKLKKKKKKMEVRDFSRSRNKGAMQRNLKGNYSLASEKLTADSFLVSWSLKVSEMTMVC